MVLTFIIIGFLIISVFVNVNLLRKNENQEDIINSQNKFISELSDNIEFTSKRLKEIDNKGSFSSDDEIGWFFDNIKNLQSVLDQFILKEGNEGEKTKTTP